MSVIGTVVSKGLVKLPDGVELQVGTQVKIETGVPADNGTDTTPQTLHEALKDFIGVADDLPADLARNHDHYLYGAPKK